MQAGSGKLEHVGIIHHNPQGSTAFLHRTSGGKLDPNSDTYFSVDFITQPLSPQRAFLLFEGAAEDTNYRYPRDRFGRLGSTHSAEHSPPEQEAFRVGPRSPAIPHLESSSARCPFFSFHSLEP